MPEAEIFVAELQQWIVSFFSLTLATNIICTSELRALSKLADLGLIAFPSKALVASRIWMLNRQIMNFAEHSYKKIVFLVLESAAVYTATLTALLILYKTESWFQYVMLDAVSSTSTLLNTSISNVYDLTNASQPCRYPPSSLVASMFATAIISDDQAPSLYTGSSLFNDHSPDRIGHHNC